MSAWQWIVAVHLAAGAAAAVLAWWHWRASAHTAGVEGGPGRQTDDLAAVADAVTRWQPVLSVYRTHTGALAVTHSDLTVNEALDVGTQCIHAAMAVTYEHTGICDAETYANGEQP